jgi:hypothetical protein
MMAGGQADHAFGRLAHGNAVLGHLQPVVQCIAQQMNQRRVQPFQNVAVDLGALSGDLETHLLAQFAPDVAHHARKRAQPVDKGRIRTISA